MFQAWGKVRERQRETCKHADDCALSSTWGAMEEHAARGADLEALKQLGVDEGQEDQLLQLRHVSVQAAHLVKGDAGVHLRPAAQLCLGCVL